MDKDIYLLFNTDFTAQLGQLFEDKSIMYRKKYILSSTGGIGYTFETMVTDYFVSEVDSWIIWTTSYILSTIPTMSMIWDWGTQILTPPPPFRFGYELYSNVQ